jgi:hypothetical protein
MTLDTFRSATPATSPPPQGPGMRRQVVLTGLRASTKYVVGVRVRGGCMCEGGPLATAAFQTSAPEYTHLSGCFVATAAYGSALAPQVETLRRARDQLRARSGLGAAAVSLYERSSPPLAGVLRETEAGRAVIRSALAPVADVVETAERLLRWTR